MHNMVQAEWKKEYTELISRVESRIESGKAKTVEFDSKEAFFNWLHKD